MTKKEIIKDSIMNRVNELDIAGYLKNEIAEFLDYFHYYKLNNIYKNIDFLVDYLNFLDHKSTRQIHELDHQNIDDFDIGDHDVHYYISKKGLEIVGERKIKEKIYQNDFGLNSVMLGIKGFLLLTVDEFCNATPVRLSIDQILRNREKEANQIVKE